MPNDGMYEFPVSGGSFQSRRKKTKEENGKGRMNGEKG
jgi:hypothetical protein